MLFVYPLIVKIVQISSRLISAYDESDGCAPEVLPTVTNSLNQNLCITPITPNSTECCFGGLSKNMKCTSDFYTNPFTALWPPLNPFHSIEKSFRTRKKILFCRWFIVLYAVLGELIEWTEINLKCFNSGDAIVAVTILCGRNCLYSQPTIACARQKSRNIA